MSVLKEGLQAHPLDEVRLLWGFQRFYGFGSWVESRLMAPMCTKSGRHPGESEGLEVSITHTEASRIPCGLGGSGGKGYLLSGSQCCRVKDSSMIIRPRRFHYPPAAGAC